MGRRNGFVAFVKHLLAGLPGALISALGAVAVLALMRGYPSIPFDDLSFLHR